VTKYNQNSTVTQPYGLRGPLRLDPCDSVVVHMTAASGSPGRSSGGGFDRTTDVL
jgi:hypothetical protein